MYQKRRVLGTNSSWLCVSEKGRMLLNFIKIMAMGLRKTTIGILKKKAIAEYLFNMRTIIKHISAIHTLRISGC